MTHDEIEHLEKAVMSLVVQALTDYRAEVVTVFREETDLPQDIAEDLTREALSTMGVSATHDRMYGKVDFKKGLYVFLPETIPVALMLDAKAEKKNGDRTATIQMSQTSMRVIMNRAGQIIDEKGRLDTEIVRGSHKYQVVTVIAKYVYEEGQSDRKVLRLVVSCIPSGRLQEKYNPNENDTIWSAGRNATTLGEDFRVRLNYQKLRDKAAWRVKEIPLNEET